MFCIFPGQVTHNINKLMIYHPSINILFLDHQCWLHLYSSVFITCLIWMSRNHKRLAGRCPSWLFTSKEKWGENCILSAGSVIAGVTWWHRQSKHDSFFSLCIVRTDCPKASSIHPLIFHCLCFKLTCWGIYICSTLLGNIYVCLHLQFVLSRFSDWRLHINLQGRPAA